MESCREQVSFDVRLELIEGIVFAQFLWLFVPFYGSSERKCAVKENALSPNIFVWVLGTTKYPSSDRRLLAGM